MTARHYYENGQTTFLCGHPYGEDPSGFARAEDILMGVTRIRLEDCEACRAVLPTILRTSRVNAGTVLLNEAATLCETAAEMLDRASRFVREAGMGKVVVAPRHMLGTTGRGLNYHICGAQKDAKRMGEWLRNYLAEDTWCSHGYSPELNGPNGICKGCDNERAHAQRHAATEKQDKGAET